MSDIDNVLARLAVDALQQTMNELAGPPGDMERLPFGERERGRYEGIDEVFRRYSELIGDSVMAYMRERT